jgi:hypothetical protein
MIIFDGLAIVGDRIRIIEPSDVDETAIVVSGRGVRIASDRLAVFGESEIEVVLSPVNEAAIVVCGSKARI